MCETSSSADGRINEDDGTAMVSNFGQMYSSLSPASRINHATAYTALGNGGKPSGRGQEKPTGRIFALSCPRSHLWASPEHWKTRTSRMLYAASPYQSLDSRIGLRRHAVKSVEVRVKSRLTSRHRPAFRRGSAALGAERPTLGMASNSTNGESRRAARVGDAAGGVSLVL